MSKNRSKQDIIRYRIEQQKQAVKNSAYFAAPMSVPEMDYFAKTRIFQASRKYIVDSMDIQNPQDRETSDLQLRSALTIDRNLRGAYGIGLDAELLRTFAAASMESQAIAYQELDRLIRDRLGIDESQQSHLFYPGFPEEVMGKNDVELYLNAIIYYGARYGADIMGFASVMQEYGMMQKEPTERTPLTETLNREMKYIGVGHDSDFHALMDGHIHGNALSASARTDVLRYAASWTARFLNSMSRPFSSKENEALCTAWLHDSGLDFVAYENHLCKDATDILRVISVISCTNGARNGRTYRDANNIRLAANPEKLLTPKSFEVRLTKKDQRFIKELMDRCPGLYRDMWREEKYWKRVMRNIDARKGPDRVVQAFDHLASGKHLDEHGQKLDSQAAMFLQAKEALHDGSGSARMAAFARNNPGYFLQRCLYVLSMAPDIEKQAVYDMAHDAAQNVGPAAALKAENAVRMRGMAGPRIIRNHSRALVPARVQNAVQLPDEEREELADAIHTGLLRRLESAREMHQVYIDPALDGIRVPQRQDTKASKNASVSTGSLIPGVRGANLGAAGISWKTPCLDLDLHAYPVAMRKDGSIECGTEVGYRNLREAWGVHSGDFTEGDPYRDGKGAQEIVMFDKDILKQHGYDYLIFSLHGYNASLANDDSIRAIIMEREGTLDTAYSGNYRDERPSFCGELIEAKAFTEAFQISATNKDVTMFAYDVSRDGFIWLDEPSLNLPEPGYQSYESMDDCAKALVHALQSPEPTMGQLFHAYAEAQQATIVTDMAKADTVFTYQPVDREEAGIREDASLVNSLETQKIYAEYCECVVPTGDDKGEHDRKDRVPDELEL